MSTLLAYLALTKPRVIELLLVTAIPAMLLADRGAIHPLLMLNTLVGGMMAAAGANTLNCVADADIDKVMKRTARRPLAREAVPTRNALALGLTLTVISFFWLWCATNLLAGVLALVTVAFYVFVYTLWLKRRTSQNVVWGGAAGCMPVMIGWSAITGTIAWPALAMFAIIFFWTPPHTWCIGDALQAGLPSGRGADAAGGGDRASGHQADLDLHLADRGRDAGAGVGDQLALRRGGPGGRWVVPDDGPPVVCRGARRRAGQAAAAVSAVEQLSGGGVLRTGRRLGVALPTLH
ncbi:protoheme IX farnesyltransferase [Mycobacterium tuberculosis CCDC5079]|nr:protoheme IX farnesyltransferase [Mycobacterium tuberculosis CCDC5079]